MLAAVREGYAPARLISTVFFATVLAAVLGAALAADPLLTLLIVATILVAIALLLAPEWMLATALVGAIVAASVFAAYLRTEGASEAQAAMLGRGRISVVIMLVALARLALDRRSVTIPRAVLLSLIAFAALVALAALVAQLRGNGGSGLLVNVRQELSYMSAFVIGMAAVARVPDRRMFQSLAILIIFAAASSVYYWAWQEGFVPAPTFVDQFFARMQAGTPGTRVNFPFTAHHPNGAAALHALLAALVVPLLLRSRSRGDLVLAVVTMTLVTAAILTTQSRTGLLALAVLPVLFLFLLRDLAGSRRATLVLGAIGIGLFAIGIVQAFPEGRSFANTGTVESRQQIWLDALPYIAEAPILGHGFGVASTGQYGSNNNSIHNEYLGRLVEGGLVGAAITTIVFLVFLRVGNELRRGFGAASDLGVGMLIFCAVLMIHMLTNETWQISSVAVLFWLLLGLGSGALVGADTEDRTRSPSDPQVSARMLR